MSAPIAGFDAEEKLYIDPIVGYRAFGFQFLADRLDLTGQIWHEFIWKSNLNEKQCFKSVTHSPPYPGELAKISTVVNEVPHSINDCSCGFYAYHHYVSVADSYGPNRSYLLGVIEGTGQVFLGTKGFRVEKARVKALCLPYSSSTWEPERKFFFEHAVSKGYPDVEIYASPAEMVTAHPSTYLDKFRTSP